MRYVVVDLEATCWENVRDFERMETVGKGPFVLCSWGGYDLNQFRREYRRYDVVFPPSFERHVNLKPEFAWLINIKPCGMARALPTMESSGALPLAPDAER